WLPHNQVAAFPSRLTEITERIHGRAVEAHLEVDVRACAEAGAAAVADHLALGDLLAAGGRDPRLMAVQRGDPAAVVDHHEVAVAGHPAAPEDLAGRRGVDRGAGRDADVDTGMERPPAHAER